MIGFQTEKAKHWQQEVRNDERSGRTMIGLAVIALFDIVLAILVYLKGMEEQDLD